MSLPVWLIIAIPIGIAIFYLYSNMDRERNKFHSIIVKCIGSFIPLSCAGLALSLKGENPFANLLFWFITLCVIADAVREYTFVSGMFIFGIAHVLFVIWLIMQESVTYINIIIWLVVVSVIFYIFRRMFKARGLDALPFCVYVIILAFIFSVSLTLPFTHPAVYIPIAVGTLMFITSDVIFGMQMNSRRVKFGKTVMFLYWGALYLISAALWYI